MRVLCIVPPYTPSYFNAGHHLAVFQVAAYLRKNLDVEVTARDFGAGNATWRDVCELLVMGFDIIAMLDDFDAVDGFPRFVRYARELAPQSRIITFGRGSRQVPKFFEQFSPDAIVSSGDYEAGVAGFVDYARGGLSPSGVNLREAAFALGKPGRFLEADEWVLPDVNEIPYIAYDRLYANDLAKFCGIPARRELVVPVARGCPVGCSFCDVPKQQGFKERRLKVSAVLSYIEKCFSRHPFEYVSFYAPTFTLRRNWVIELCSQLRERLPTLKWKCVTTLAHLDNTLIQEMAGAGCVRVSVGVETLYDDAAKHLPKLKQRVSADLERVADACTRAGIELNCFVMIGMPGEPIDAARRTIEALINRGFRVRPTVYTPYENMRGDMDVGRYGDFNRQLLLHGSWDSQARADAYDLLYANTHDRPTAIEAQIPHARQVS